MRQKRATHELYDMEGIAKVLSFDDVDGDGPIGGDSRVWGNQKHYVYGSWVQSAQDSRELSIPELKKIIRSQWQEFYLSVVLSFLDSRGNTESSSLE